MASQDNTLRLLIAEESLNDAETLISVLRNAGHAVRATRVEDDEDLAEALAAGQYDLMLCSSTLEELPLQQACGQIKRAGKDIPVLAIAGDENPEQRLQAMTDGALDFISKHDLKHLQMVIQREVRHLSERRRLRKLEAALRETEKRCYALLDSSRDAIAYVHEGMHIYANQAYLERFGFASMEDIEGMPLLDMAAGGDQGRLKEFLRGYQKSGGQQDDNELELSMVSDAGDEFPVIMTFSEASIEGEPCTQILMRDKSSQRELEQQLDSLSKQDITTGLYNRQYFMERLEQVIGGALDGGDGGGLLFIQIDNVDALRQAMGITGIDLVANDIAALIRDEIGDDGIAARFGDDAFSVLVAGKTVHDAIAIGEAIRQKIEDHIAESDGKTVTTTCSIGITTLGETSGDPQQAINGAHQASEDARGKGGNQVELFTSKEEHDRAKVSDLRRRLEEALQNDDFYLVYQPVASLQGDTTENYEVRVRMTGEAGSVMPGDFVPQAEQAGAMPALDRWIVEHALQSLALRQKAGQDTVLFVKLSGTTLTAAAEFLPFLTEQLQSSKVEPHRLVFQVNEPVAVTQLNQAKEIFRGLRQLGCRFSLDHFGSGLNPFQLVKHLPADFLKLDSALTHNLSDSDENQASVRQLISNAHETGRKIIAGYLEDASSLALLWQYGTDYVQGYFLAEPSREMDYDFSGMVI